MLYFFNLMLYMVLGSVCASEVEYRWVFSDALKLSSGRCYEVSPDLQIKNIKDDEIYKYFKQVDTNRCRPEETIFVFDTVKGVCYEADKESRGKQYLSGVDTKSCRPEMIIFRQMERLGKMNCYEVDKATLGREYFFRVDGEKCINKKTVFAWRRISFMNGTCHDISKTQRKPPKVDKENCRPDEVVYRFHKVDNFKGYCLEQDKFFKNPYSVPVKIENCKPKNTIFTFYKKTGRTYGKCYEIDEDTKGERYISTVNIDKCK